MSELQAIIEEEAQDFLLGLYSDPTDLDMTVISAVTPSLANIGRFVNAEDLDIVARGLINAWWSGYEKALMD